MLDFKELSKDGQDLELLTREILFSLGHRVYWSGRGPDSGKDLVFIEEYKSILAPSSKKWLVQCKHKAESSNAVGTGELDGILDSCAQHECEGYLLVTSTYPSSTVAGRLEDITSSPNNHITATYWDSVKIEQILSTPDLWVIAQRFFPISTQGWKIYATERPNNWVANYKGFYFHISNRIGSDHMYQLEYIEEKVEEIIKSSDTLPGKHFFRLRSIYFDDKHGTYTWYIDYMHPHGTQPVKSPTGDFDFFFSEEWNENYDFKTTTYLEHSDHYDKDHYDYYDPHVGQFILGMKRF